MRLLAGLSPLDIAMIISIPSAILLGAVIFFFAGLHRVPKNHAIIIEKARNFYCVYDSGTHFKMPIAYQRVGIYCIAPQTKKYIANNGNSLDITYQIEDVKLFHYSEIGIDQLMKKIEKENSEINLTILNQYFAKYGLKFINIKKSLN